MPTETSGGRVLSLLTDFYFGFELARIRTSLDLALFGRCGAHQIVPTVEATLR